jgi:integrase
MQKNTRKEYWQIAEKFLADYQIIDMCDLDKINEAFSNLAVNASPKYWYRKRRALVVRLEANGMNAIADHVSRIKYPINKKEMPGTYFQALCHRRQQVKKISRQEHMMLFEYCQRKKDFVLQSALLMAWLLGCCRPIELTTLKILSNNQIKIKGAKKTKDGQRGLDRVLQVDEHVPLLVEKWLELFDFERNKKDCAPDRAMRRIQRRLENATKALWPERENQITFYTYRHQFGADIKGFDTNRIDAAAMMGHQSVDSLDAYGNARNAKRQPNIKSAVESAQQVRKRERKQNLPHLKRLESELSQYNA